ncbi:FAD-dependent oxidoreductase [Arthrobacter sp.]|uniref:FAD-dependent oxidoreductase n=1 Tax=Arthrobacter sp. TaxID=1667 RepID=UPI003A93CBF1
MIDVLIAGGGPCGLALASLLLDAGFTVRVLEARHCPGTHSRAIGLHPPALEVLDAVGVGDAAVTAGVRIRGGVGLAGGREIASLDFGILPGPHRYILSLPQAQTVRLLEDRVKALDAGALLRGARLETYRQDEDGVRVAFTTADASAGPGTGGTRHTLGARFLIGADGVDSTVRTLAGEAFAGGRYRDRYVMGDYPDGTGFGATAALVLHREGIVESFPLPDGLRRWVAWRLPREPVDLPGLVLRRTGHVLAREAAEGPGNFRCSRRSVRSMASGRVFLIGDAAHEVSPIGGQGMALGLMDAAALAPLLARTLRGDAGDMSRAAFAAFSTTRLRAAARAGRQAHLNMMLGRPLPPAVDRLRGRGLSALSGRRALLDIVAHRFTMSRGFS